MWATSSTPAAPQARRPTYSYRATREIARLCYVPQEYSQAAAPGLTADLTTCRVPGRRFQGSWCAPPNAINNVTRTLQIEVDVDNPTGKLLSGSYAEVH